jgi:starch synthase (maltosyl-transferring)
MTTQRRALAADVNAEMFGEFSDRRVLIEDIFPTVDAGRYPIKRIAGEAVEVWADILRHGHDVIAAALLWRRGRDREWCREPMAYYDNDRWVGSFVPPEPERYVYAIEAWTDTFATWRRDVLLKRDAGLNIGLELKEGFALLAGLKPCNATLRAKIDRALEAFEETGTLESLLVDELIGLVEEGLVREDLTCTEAFVLICDRPIARAGAWYELFPRSQSQVPGQHGTFNDCIARLTDIAELGFDVVYLPPIHPIGRTNRKGKNNALTAGPNDPGSPYAIGSQEGGHDAVHPELGSLDDFRRLIAACRERGLELALDFAIQCSPDHPWLAEHPNWFARRPDGSIRYAENPPKKYEDIVNPDFSCADRTGLWGALRDVVLFWLEQGVRIFRVDNPHTKPFPFWEWLIAEVKARDPGVVFLAEAFTRPKVMKALAKLGFSQSYTYFTWRTTKQEFEAYLTELTRYPEREYFRPNFFTNTPDILPIHLQGGEPWMFKSRLALAATLSGNYGIYNGFELLEHTPIPGKEEYLDSEKYELKIRDWNKPGNIREYIGRLNRLRKGNPALLQTTNLWFAAVDDDQVIGFVKEGVYRDNAVAVAVALAGDRVREFWFHFGNLEIGPQGNRRPVSAIENLITGERRQLEWGGAQLRIDPADNPALLFRCLPES